ncbi:type IIL restriction-modification enzyme MmeI [Neisseria sp. Dent CA1/247]|uniref:type IIL restriction-modification enzyme MmeI n=1 Tax=Neisseria sp. Dent CA1/247 TaxID=2912675 RepID=UPI00351E5416
MVYGNKPADGGHLLLCTGEKEQLVRSEPLAKNYLRPFLGADEFINGKQRWCLWFHQVSDTRRNHDLKHMPQVSQRIAAVKAMRQASTKAATQKQAEIPHLFTEIRQPESGNYLIIPRVSSETRRFIPIGFMGADTINSDANFSLPNATLYHFGILCSTMHNAFMRTVAGRLKSDYRYSNTLVYNNFPFPFIRKKREEPDSSVKKHLQTIEKAAQQILDARAAYAAEARAEGLPEPSLADLYRADAGYTRLDKAHAALDKAVDAAYGYQGKNDDAERVAFLFDLYEKAVSGL